MILKKRPFTLLETLIALALTSLILVGMMSLFRQISQTSQMSERLQQETFKLRYLENRLSQVFPKAVATNVKTKDFYFFTSPNPPGLILSYDNGSSKQKEFSNTVLGRFFWDPASRRFYLATWPSPEKWVEGTLPPIKLEVLLEDVQEVSWSFFVPPDKGWKPKSSTTSQPNAPQPTKDSSPKVQKVALKPPVDGGWVNEWSQEYQLLPGLVRLKLVSGGKTEQFIFPLSKTERQIVYTQ
jgi:type II secretory pathway component PulJ